MGKVAMTELNQRVTNLTMEPPGADAMPIPTPYPGGTSRAGPEGLGGSDPRVRFLRARANTIEGGTSETQRNNIGDHVLGLPGGPRVDKTLPWSPVPRSPSHPAAHSWLTGRSQGAARPVAFNT